ncbi:MAG: ammonia-forming cytochrome c nitrite reductase subunit c552 [Deltaproteobacteria bacterium]|nr:ammonia-forming cytochrome c nitrite reductase subunit c552 [Deltaproteobacteria bacterium]
MKTRLFILIFILVLIISGIVLIKYIQNKWDKNLRQEIAAYSGSGSCRPCHEKFYQLWHDSYHGLAMQPVTGAFIRENIHSFNQAIRVGMDTFKISWEGDTLFFIEHKVSGKVSRFPAVHTMGGKYIYYFLTPFPGGRLQVLPLAYDCDTESWYNNPESGVRHFENIEDAPLDWRNHLFTFNTTCYNCHVSQLETNYDLADNSYNTTWREPGINCETCHGPSYDHIVACVKAGEGNTPEDLKIVQTSMFTSEQHNSACGSCHAKATVIAQSFELGGLFYDYFDLITLENPDFYADGRDLGENYTMTTWEMNKCAAASDMHCVDCHTSSGRYRFAGENANDACMPCHDERVNKVSEHSFHDPDSEASKCIACHIPKTSFARMDRSDHSFRPPMPRATMAFGSPNACNICHDDQSTEWAEKSIKETHKIEYQNEAIVNGELIRKAREGDWSELDKILTGLEEERFDNVYATSFIRLLEQCNDTAKWAVVYNLTYHKSPLVRGAAAHSLSRNDSEEAFERLMQLIDDQFRAVRLNAAFALSSLPLTNIGETDSVRISEALEEYEASLVTHSDSWSAHYNLGNYYSNQNEFRKALNSYNTSFRIYPEAIMPMVNAGFIYSMIGDYERAQEMFIRALSIEPDHEATLTNIALLYGERGDNAMAAQYFKRLMEVSDKNALAAYNLAVLLSKDNLDEIIEMSRKAMDWEPRNPKYAYTYAFYLLRSNNTQGAKEILENVISGFPHYIESYLLLADILTNAKKYDEAKDILQNALEINGLSNEQQRALLENLQQLEKYAN